LFASLQKFKYLKESRRCKFFPELLISKSIADTTSKTDLKSYKYWDDTIFFCTKGGRIRTKNIFNRPNLM